MQKPTIYLILDWFIPESLKRDAEARRAAQLFVASHFVGPIFGSGLLFNLCWIVDRSPGAHRVIALAAMLAFSLYPLLLRLTGRLVLVAHLSGEHFVLLILYVAYLYGGPVSPFLGWMLSVPLYELCHTSRESRASILALAIFIGHTPLLFVLYLLGVSFPEHVPLASLQGAATLSAVLGILFVTMMSRYFSVIVGLQRQQIQGEIANRRDIETRFHHLQRLESLGTLAGGVAHELNNALVPVLALTKRVARDTPEGSRDRKSLDLVLQGAVRARDLVGQILAFSRKENPRREIIDVAEVLRDALQMMHASLPATIRFEEQIAAVPAIEGDAGQLHQVIINLITNAAQAIGTAAGTITIDLAAELDARRIRLSVADTGCGMDEATKIRIFEPFFTTKGVGQGSGLGLSVVHGIVASHHGSIEVTSAWGKGTRFDVVLPIETVEVNAA